MTKRLTRAQAIKAKCLDCSGHQPKEVKLCHLTGCPLWPYRLGYEVDNKSTKSAKTQKS